MVAIDGRASRRWEKNRQLLWKYYITIDLSFLELVILTTKMSTFHDFWMFEPVEPRIYSFYYAKILKSMQENYGEIFGNRMFPYLRI